MATSRAAAATAQGVGDQTLIGAASLAVGPLVMAVGDLLHPKETSDIGGQALIVAAQPARWYLAHLLLLIGLALFVPGLLALTNLAAARAPRAGYAARVLLVMGVGGTSAVFVAEMLAGRLGAGGAAATEELLGTMFSGPIAGPMLLLMLAFFMSAVVVTAPLLAPGPLRRPAGTLLAGTLLILGEVVSSQVLLSQIGNLLVWAGGVGFARLLLRGRVDTAPEPRTSA